MNNLYQYSKCIKKLWYSIYLFFSYEVLANKLLSIINLKKNYIKGRINTFNYFEENVYEPKNYYKTKCFNDYLFLIHKGKSRT